MAKYVADGDSPTETLNINAMSSDELDELIEAIRERRMEPVRHFEEAQRLEREQRQSKLTEQLKKQNELFMKELERVDRGLDKLTTRSVKIRTIRLEMEWEHVGSED